jgi:hypothetical protein
VRGRGSPQQPAKTCAIWTGARADVQANAQGQDTVPLGSLACVAARRPGGQRTATRRSPSRPREAAGSPAPRPERWSNCSIAQVVGRCSLSETARASVCAKRVQAWPWPCFCSKRARDFGPAGLVRRNRSAAAEQAHVRDAVPIFVPAVPDRWPADALAPLPKRPEETQSWTRGQRAPSGMAYTSTRRRLWPRPGTLGSPYRGGGRRLLGRRDQRQLESPQPIIRVPKQGQGDVAPLRDGGRRQPLGDAVTGGLVGARLATLGQRVLTVRLLPMGQERCPCPYERYPPPEQGAGGPPLRRLDRRLREPAPPPAPRDCLGIDCVVLGLTPLDGLHL